MLAGWQIPFQVTDERGARLSLGWDRMYGIFWRQRDQKAFCKPACLRVWFAQCRDLMKGSTMNRRLLIGLSQIS